MTSNQRSPMWPYLLVLTGLFVLSLAVPRGWRDEAGTPVSDSRRQADRQRTVARAPKIAPPVTVVRPSPELIPSPSTSQIVGNLWDEPARGSIDPLSSSRSFIEGLSVGEFLTEHVSKRIADLRSFGVPDSLWNSVALSRNLLPNHSGAQDAATEQSTSSRTTITDPQENSPSANQSTETQWPTPHSLLKQLQNLAQTTECAPWATRVEERCNELCQISIDDLQKAGPIILQLRSLADRAEPLAEAFKNPRSSEELRRARYALERRLSVWEAVSARRQKAAVFANISPGSQQRRRLSETLSDAGDWLSSSPYADAWRKYLLLDELSQMVQADPPPVGDEAGRLARRALARLSQREATETQRQVLENRTLQSLAEQLRLWAADTIDVRDVLSSVEQYEVSGLPSDARRVASIHRQLKWSAAEEDRRLAQKLEVHYRNANLRIALSADFLNRFAPEQITATGAVNDRVLGAVVRGRSESAARLQLRMIPDPGRLHFSIDGEGVVDSQTEASRGPATFSNVGESRFTVHKEVIVDRQGWNTTAASAQAKSNSEVTGVHTELDGVPLFGGLARRRATAKEEKRHEAAEHEMDERVALSAEQRANAEVDRILKQTEQAVRGQVLAPLAKLALNVEPISLETTAPRATARLRILGDHQLGSHTSRPQAPADSLASMQLHETAINNVVDQWELAGRSFTLPELASHLAQRMGWPEVQTPIELPSDVVIAFAKDDPVRVRFQNGAVRLTLGIAKLQDSKRTWQDFSVTAAYEPWLDGLQIRLARQGAIELGGENYKGQPELMLRGIFSKIFAREQTLDMVPAMLIDHPRMADLCVTQCVLEDSWLGLAIGPDRSTHRSRVAAAPVETTAR